MPSKISDPSKIKLIATDIDGTLLNPEGELSERTKTIIKKVLKKYPELHFVLASGRARPATTDICESLDLISRPNTELILSNGCIIYDSKGAIIWQSDVPGGFIIESMNLLDSINVNTDNFMYSCGDDSYMFDKDWEKKVIDEFEEQTILISKEEYIKKVKSKNSKVNRVSYLVKNKKEAEEIEEHLKELKTKYDLESMYSFGIFLDYMPSNSNKGTALTQLIKDLNIKKEEVMAFGDGNNDIDLLQSVGYPVAMGNATDELKSHAKYVTKSNKEDGLASVLEEIFLKNE